MPGTSSEKRSRRRSIPPQWMALARRIPRGSGTVLGFCVPLLAGIFIIFRRESESLSVGAALAGIGLLGIGWQAWSHFSEQAFHNKKMREMKRKKK